MDSTPHRLSDQDTTAMTATCAVCGPVAIIRRSIGERVRYECKIKRRSRPRSKEDQWGHVKKKYGLSPARWASLLIQQSGLCSICGEQMLQPHVDHDHATGVIRSMLCRPCNVGLGMFRDDPARLQAALDYLAQH